jgi:hypothetical protein
MIVKAYNQARLYADAFSLPESPSSKGTTSIPELANPNKPSPPRVSSQPSAGVHKIPLKQRSVKVQPMHTGKRPMAPNPVNVPYRQMLRELRQTKAKLDQLESTHRRLTESQLQLQSQLAELLSQVKEHDLGPTQPSA